MAHLKSPVEHGRPAKHHVFLAHLVRLLYILRTRKPHKVHHPSAVAKVGHHTLLARPHVEGLEGENRPLHLHKRHLERQLPYLVNLGSVNMLVGVILQQVAKRADAQLLAEYLLPLRTHTAKVLYVLLKYAAHFSLAKIQKK